MRRFLLAALAAAIFVCPWAVSQERPKHARGHKPASPAVRARLHAEAFARNGHRVKAMPKTDLAAFDCRTAFGNVLPVNDQGSCGDCFMVSAFDCASMAMVKGGVLPLDPVKGRLASQWGLDCHGEWGACGGGDEAEVINFLYKTGAPLTSDYGPYTANPGRCKSGSWTIYKLGGCGYCTSSQQDGPAATADMKTCMVHYGPLSVAFDAGGCDGYRAGGVMTGRGNNVDHAVLCIGWRTNSAGKTEFLGMNQWGDWGGDTPQTSGNGLFWIEEGAYSWGTEAMWVTAGNPPPPPPNPTTGNAVTLTSTLMAGTYPILSGAGLPPLGSITLTGSTAAGSYPLGNVPVLNPVQDQLDRMQRQIDTLNGWKRMP